MNYLCRRFVALSTAARAGACQAHVALRSASTSASSSSPVNSSQSSPSQGIAQVRMRAFDPVSLQSVASEVVAAGVRAGLSMSGIIPRPKLTRLYTVLRSPHIDKKARDQFHMIVRCAGRAVLPTAFRAPMPAVCVRKCRAVFHGRRRKRLVIVKSGTPQALGAFQAALEQVSVLFANGHSPGACACLLDAAMQVDKKGVDLNVKHMNKQT
jgi:ribosomal protein S10